MMAWLIGIWMAVFLATSVSSVSIRVVSWNVGDNKGMGGGINKTSLRQILGLETFERSKKAYQDVYAVTFQESCYSCDEDEWQDISNLVLNELNRENPSDYEYVGHAMTRESSKCESWACSVGQHGTTNMYVFAKRGLLQLVKTMKTNKCMSGWLKNAEKGIAGVKVQLRNKKPTMCFAGVHLDSNSPEERRECFKEFVEDHKDEWLDCTMTFYAGDFNTRTGDKGGPEQSRWLDRGEVARLTWLDEMRGNSPYGGIRLVNYVSDIHKKRFDEGAPINFYPTYSLRPISECGNRSPCYRGDRPPSWTDRIILNPPKTFRYDALPILQSDHYPVYGIYRLREE